MQRLNRSATAPKGAAFLLFLGLAIVPISLKAAGFQLNLNPNLSAAADVLQQITDVFGPGYQPARTFDSSIPTDQGTEPLRAFDSSACASGEFACSRALGEVFTTVEGACPIPSAKAAGAGVPRRVCRKAAARASTDPSAIEQITMAAENTKSLETHVRALRTLSALKLEAITHGELFRKDALLKDTERQIVERSLAIPQNLRLVVRSKSTAIPFAAKAAQCKVRAALDSAVRSERERAIVTSWSSSNPDNCEL